jgi:hypothetical protein
MYLPVGRFNVMYSFYVFGGQLNKISDRKAGYVTVEAAYL